MEPPRQYHRRSLMHGLPMNIHYTGSPVDAQGAPQMLSFDGLPRAQPNGHFMNTWSSNILSHTLIPTPMPINQTPAEWPSHSRLLTTDFDDQSTNEYYGYSTIQNNATDASFPRSMNYAGVPRTWSSPYEPRMTYDGSIPSKTYDPSSYTICPQREPIQNTSASTSGPVYDAQESSRDFARLSISHSPNLQDDNTRPAVPSFDTPSGFVMPSRESSDESGSNSRELTVADDEDHGSDEPYAKLIYRALMSKGDHSMALQEIYQWFRDNTTKGRSNTKGWMNSIRHNLSMNAAFKKTEQKTFGDETKKSTEWVLEKFAIKDGVQSTTRYRKGTGNKKSAISDNSAHSRQSSGRRRGICGGKTRFSRQKIKDELSKPRHSIQRLDTRRHSHQHHSRSQISQRQVSPPTPCPKSMPSSSPYFFPKREHFDISYENACGLGDVQGVYVDDGPIFSNGRHSPVSLFHSPHSMCASQRY